MGRLALIRPRIISFEQIGFVKGHSIFDNAFLAQELFQDLVVKIYGENIIFKVDITKAYDNLNWELLYNVLNLFGFKDDFY
ncbi:integrator complex subunit 11 [Dendrobium catenatum]|uniref:Integrator complex subunit 11 n=1 Tax=Dendrobium catenatum TaxID=906689 RepID=A0A2I0XG26_9ASPA|nr:integrator complex subunit 11 [Dendrobium catenatum]